MNTKPLIEWIDDRQAKGPIGEIYQRWKDANPDRDSFPDILKCFSGDPRVLKGLMDFCYPLQFSDGALTRQTKELLATFVSALNRCKY